jgi:5-methylcytosine-specific restriction endonuclease McrA
MDTARDFADRLSALLRKEQGAMADFLLALADFDRRRLWQTLGYSSLFHFLHRELGMSKGAAHYRKTAAELIQRIPGVVEPLREGKLCITSIIELAKVLTPENRDEVLPRFFHRSRQEARAVSAELAPMEAAPHRTVVTAIPLAASARTAPPEAPASLALNTASMDRNASADPTSGAAVQPVELEVPPASAPTRAAPRSAAEPLTADLRRLHVTVSKRFMEKLEAARDALSHSHPGADVETLLEEGLDLLLERAAKRRGLVKKPRARARRPSDSERANPRHVPAEVSREVFRRDDGRCQWKTADGGICGSTHRVELDHAVPVARGGKSTAANLRVLCGFHNDLAAREAYGDRWMDQFTRRTKRPTSPPAQAP